MSIDCKATVAIGEVSRGGLTRGDYRACDHDLGLHEKYIPCGIVEEDSAQLRITFGSSFKTSDFIVDALGLGVGIGLAVGIGPAYVVARRQKAAATDG